MIRNRIDFSVLLKYSAAPLLFSAYPVLFLYSGNIEILNLRYIALPLPASLLMGTVVFAVFRIVIKNMVTASVAASGFLILFWHYGLIYRALAYYSSLKHWHIFPLVVFLFALFLFLLIRFNEKIEPENINKILIVTGIFLIVFNLYHIVPGEIDKFRKNLLAEQHESVPEADAPGKDYQFVPDENIDPAGYPDIYLLIFDEYARLDTIYEEWGYDNSAFADFLSDRGVYLAGKSEKLFFLTIKNIASLLNIEYVSRPSSRALQLNYFFGPDFVEVPKDAKKMIPVSKRKTINQISDNFIVNFMNSAGYYTILLEGLSQHYPGIKMKEVDYSLSYQDIISSKTAIFKNIFASELLKQTLFLPFIRENSYKATKFIIDFLKTSVHDIEGPKFIYAHIMCPHGPFVFDRKGNHTRPTGDNNYDYLEQYIYITGEIEEIVKSIQENSENAVILLQSDHGPRPNLVELKDPYHAFRVLNAVYFPDEDYSDLYESISTVNTLRVVLNKYFNHNYEMLEDM